MPKRSTSKREAKVAIISIAQHARPNVTGQIDDLRAQLKIFSVDVVTIQPPGMWWIASAIHHMPGGWIVRSEEHTSELQSRLHLVCRLLLEKKNYIR